MRLLFVCSGNICRSPLAEVLARRYLDARGRSDVAVRSAGIAAFEDTPVSEGAYLVALEHGLDLGAHRAQRLTEEMVAESDLILGMAWHHVDRAEALGGLGKSFLLGEYARRPEGTGLVEDPFGAPLEAYRDTYAELEALVRDAVARLVREAPRRAGGADRRDQ